MVRGYHYSNLGQEHSFFFALQPGPWVLGAWASDANFLYWSVDREREQYVLVFCGASYANAAGQRVLTCSTQVRYAEVLSSAMKVELFSSDPEHVVVQAPLDQVLADGNLILPDDDPKRMGV